MARRHAAGRVADRDPADRARRPRRAGRRASSGSAPSRATAASSRRCRGSASATCDYLTRGRPPRPRGAGGASTRTPATASASRASCAPGPGEAEPAIVVADDWQGRGVGDARCSTRWPTARARRAWSASARRSWPRTPRRCACFERLGADDRSARTAARSSCEIELPPAPAPPARSLGVLRAVGRRRAGAGADAAGPRWCRGAGGALDEPRGNLIVVGTDGSERRADVAVGAARRRSPPALDAGVHVVGVHRLLLPDRGEIGDDRRADRR